MPALLITSVTSPQSATAAATCDGLFTSRAIGITPGSVTCDGSRAPAYTLRAPRAKAWRANSSPRPRFAPVTRMVAFYEFMRWFLRWFKYHCYHIFVLEKPSVDVLDQWLAKV